MMSNEHTSQARINPFQGATLCSVMFIILPSTLQPIYLFFPSFSEKQGTYIVAYSIIV